MRTEFPSLLRRFVPPHATRPAAIPVVLAIAVLALAGCRKAEEAPKEEIRPVRVVTIDRIASGDSVSLTGTVQAETEVNLSFRIDGRMIERSGLWSSSRASRKERWRSARAPSSRASRSGSRRSGRSGRRRTRRA